MIGIGGDCFEALTRVREQIEPAGWLLGVNGARRDTWASGMCRGLGAFQVYRLTPGARLTNADRVQTFHEAPRETLGTIAEQILFEHQWNPDPVAAPSGPTPAVHPVTDALRAVATHQRGGYVYAIDPYFDPHRAVPPYGIVGGWSVDNTGRLVAFSHNPNYRASPAALEFPTPLSALEVTMHLAITGYGSEADLFAAFRDAALSVFPPPPPDSQRDPRTVTDPDGSRYIAAFTHPDHTPGTWRQWHRTTGRELAAAGLPVRLNPGHHISLTVPAEALRV
ncbi:type VII secretion system-associated protein [Streptomyces canus]|uniref:type VII secretion system-associated protein n=1 Tax=Streptomyces canus TaxID=58343 RepID=UPI0032452E26